PRPVLRAAAVPAARRRARGGADRRPARTDAVLLAADPPPRPQVPRHRPARPPPRRPAFQPCVDRSIQRSDRAIRPRSANHLKSLGRAPARHVLYGRLGGHTMKPVMTILFCLISATALAQPKPGTYTGVRECKGTSGSIEVDATSKKTIGVATCKTE